MQSLDEQVDQGKFMTYRLGKNELKIFYPIQYT